MLHLTPGIFGCLARVIIKTLTLECRTKQNAGPGRRVLLPTVLTVTLLTHQAPILHMVTLLILQAPILLTLTLRHRVRKSRFGILTG